MADEKTTPTPKKATTDTMHSSPDAPDRSQMDHPEREGEEAPAPKGVQRPPGQPQPGEQEVIETPEAGTLVTTMPEAPIVPAAGPVNPGNPAPETPLAGETEEEFKERIETQRDRQRQTLVDAKDAATKALEAFDKQSGKIFEGAAGKGAKSDAGSSSEGSGASEGSESDEDWSARTVDELKEELADRGLATSGTKAELIARLEEDEGDAEAAG